MKFIEFSQTTPTPEELILQARQENVIVKTVKSSCCERARHL